MGTTQTRYNMRNTHYDHMRYEKVYCMCTLSRPPMSTPSPDIPRWPEMRAVWTEVERVKPEVSEVAKDMYGLCDKVCGLKPCCTHWHDHE